MTGTLVAVSMLAGCGGSGTAGSDASSAPAQETESSTMEENTGEEENETATDAGAASEETAQGENYTIAVMVKDSSTPFGGIWYPELRKQAKNWALQ